MFEQESYDLLDTKLLFVFLENIAHNYLGKDVLLSTGERARIIFIHNQSPSRPIVQVNELMIDLMFEPTITIDEIL
jgi:HD-GYP domain-containing protein (c-di-GMP phosphodiesterase class II)